jgi:formylglycine-generating enzyme required for sulfatase activity
MQENRDFGDYRVIKQIGQGSLGTVYLAEHRFMKKHYILKILPQELSQNRNFIQSFEENIAALAALKHKNIVGVHNISYANGVYFLVTDCIVDDLGESTNLARYLASLEKPITESQLHSIVKQIASALSYIHQQKVLGSYLVHNHLKLNNILIGKSNPELEVVVSDCGLAKIIGMQQVLSKTCQVLADSFGMGKLDQYSMVVPAINEESSALNQAKRLMQYQVSFIQNYAFLAPEQKKTIMKEVGPASDVYAFGVLVYYLITKKFPEGVFDLSEINADFKMNWGELIWQCLQQDPEKRPEDLEKALEKYLQEPVKRNDSAEKPQIAEEEETLPLEQEACAPYVNEKITKVLQEKIDKVTTFASKEIVEEEVPVKPVELAASYQVKKTAEIQIKPPQVKPVAVAAPVQTEELKPVIQETSLSRPVYEADPLSVFQIDPQVTVYQQQRVEKKEIEPLLTDMIIIQGGEFNRGADNGNRDEAPRHCVDLESFAIDIHPVTNEQFIRFLEVMGGEKDVNNNDIIRLRESRIRRSAGRLSIESGYSKHPVVGVTWYGSMAYANWIGKRLPSEAEWEIAARGGLDIEPYPTGDKIEKTQSNFFSSDTTTVMSYAANNHGLYDMSGNVYEWCQDWYGYNYYEESSVEPSNPKGPVQGVYRVVRGGCWKSLKEDLRCSHRHRNNPGTFNRTYGFRCTADVS